MRRNEFASLDITRLHDPMYRTYIGPEGRIRLSIKQRVLVDVALKRASEPTRVRDLANRLESRTQAIRRMGVNIDGGTKVGFSPNAFDDQLRQLAAKGLDGFLEVIGFTKKAKVIVHPEVLEKYHRPEARKHLRRWASSPHLAAAD